MNTGVIWDKPIMFTRLIEDCGHRCELITPNLLAAPFFRRQFHAVIIPSGFAHPTYSRVLPALRAIQGRLKRYLLEGGTLLIFGAGEDKPDAYDWLPIPVKYRFGFSEGEPVLSDSHHFSCITNDCPDITAIDGTIEPEGGTVILTCNDCPILWTCNSGRGRIIISTLHEYPSREFLSEFCVEASEALL